MASILRKALFVIVIVCLRIKVHMCHTKPENVSNLEELTQLKLANYDFKQPYGVPNEEMKQSFSDIGILHLLNLDIIYNLLNEQTNQEFEKSERTKMYNALIRPLDHPTTKEKTKIAAHFPESPYILYYIYSGDLFEKIVTKFHQAENEPLGADGKSLYSKEDLISLSFPLFEGIGDADSYKMYFQHAKALSMGILNEEVLSQSVSVRIAKEFRKDEPEKFFVLTVETANTLSKIQYLEYATMELFGGVVMNSKPGQLEKSLSKIPEEYRHLFFTETQYHFVANYLFEKLLRELPKSYRVVDIDDFE